MGCDQNFRELRIKSERDFTYHNLGETEICEWQFYPFVVILSEKLVSFIVAALEIAEIT